jgi:DNA-directed RNA polymerase specialized sigma24 family protein
MVQETMVLVAKKHKEWIKIVISFGCDKEIAEDIVQEMYIKIQLKLEKGLDIMYGKEINYYYIFKTLKSLFYDLKRKGKNITIVNIEDNINDFNTQIDINYDSEYEKITDSLSEMYWYNRKVFEIINGGEKIAELSRKSGIPYYSLYNTYNKVKSKLKKLLIIIIIIILI